MYQVTVLLEKSSVLYQGKMCQLQKFRTYRKVYLFGVLQNVFTDKVLDLIVMLAIVMLAKFYIYNCKWQETAPNLKVFLRILKDRYTVDICILLQTIYMILTYSGFPARD